MKRMVIKLLGLVTLMSLLVSPVVAQVQTSERPPLDESNATQVTDFQVLEFPTSFKEDGRYIILLNDDSLATYKGDVPGLRVPAPTLVDGKLDVTSAESVQYLDYLRTQQDNTITKIEASFGRALEIDLRYDVILNGFVSELTAAEANKLLKRDDVQGVYFDELWQPDTDVSPEFIGADQLWSDTDSTPGALATQGEGMIVGIIDTGINMDHPSFADLGGDGYDHTNPNGSGNYFGLCDTDDTNYVCNDKLIGVYGYTAGDEAVTGEDAEAHGSHTASTAAGNYLELEYNGVPVTVSGMAPHANIIAYDVCYADGCPNSYSVAAVQQAVIDGVDVLNYSIGPNAAVNPYTNAVELAMLEAVDAGILTSTSAGNAGPDASTVYKAPAWSLIVANTSHGRIFGFPVEVHEPAGAALYEAVALPGVGIDFTTDVLNSPIRWAGDDDTANVTGCSAFSADFFDGSIALISRGGCGFVDKIDNAAAAGADGVLIYNNSGGPPIIMGGIETTTIPSAMLDKEDGDAIVALISGTLQVNIESDYVSANKQIWGDILSQGSSRGPYELLDILTPEVSAPGTNVLAAYNTPGESAPYGGVSTDAEIYLMSGTSMASPHGAGSALLLMDLFPSWTPMEIKSAIIMSAYDDTTVKDDGITPTDPFDDGNGRIDLTKAALIGLVMDETVSNFKNADPSLGGDVKTLNIPSYQDSQCVGACTFTRTVRNVAGVETDYTVMFDAPEGVVVTATPSTFTIPLGGTQEVLFEIDVQGAEMGAWQFVSATFATDDTFTSGEAITDARFQMAVMPDPGNLPALVEKEVYRDAGGVVLEDLYSIEITDLTIETAGLTEADLFEFSLAGDPTNDDPFDNLDDVWYTTFTIPEGTKRVVMEILETSASDLDLFFGFGPTPSADTLWDYSATGATLEYLSEVDPIAYDWWVLVENWGGDETLDDVTLALGLVPDVASTNFEVSGPTSVPALDEFSLEVTWDIPEMEPLSAWYGWFNLGSAPATPGDIGQTELNVYRPYDDVTKEDGVDYVALGDVFTYTITIAPNQTGADLDYVIHDVLPDGVEYIDGSLQTVGSFIPATYDDVENAIHWEDTMPKIEYTYVASDNTNNPEYCGMPVGDGSYVDALTTYGYATSPTILGDEQFFYFDPFANTEYYGDLVTTPPIFTDDGYIGMDWNNFVPWDYINRPFPDTTAPDGIIAPWMRDMIIIYDEASNAGVTAVNYGVGYLVEFDDVVDYWGYHYPGDVPYSTMDYEIFMWKELDPTAGYPDIIVAFDNVTGDWDWNAGPWGSVGLENMDASLGTTYAYDDWTPTSGDIVCFDFTMAGADPVVITFDVEVTATEPLLIKNSAMHTANGFNMVEEEAVAVAAANAAPPVADSQSLETQEETPLNITLTGSELTPGPQTWVLVSLPEHGVLSGTAPDLVYTPDLDYYGMDQFTFFVNDGLTDSNVATIDIEVKNVNDTPLAQDDYYEMFQPEDTDLVVDAPGVMENDSDDDPTDELSVFLKDEPEHGEVVLNSDGSFTYTPDEGYFGVDSFTYTLLGFPERGYTDWATVYITIHFTAEYYMPLFIR